LRTRAIPERFRGVFTTRRYTNTRLPLPLPSIFCIRTCFPHPPPTHPSENILARSVHAQTRHSLSLALAFISLCFVCDKPTASGQSTPPPLFVSRVELRQRPWLEGNTSKATMTKILHYMRLSRLTRRKPSVSAATS